MVIQIAKLSAEGWYVFITIVTSVHDGTPPNLLKKVYVYATLGAVCRGDGFELYLARPVPQGLTRRSPSSDSPPLSDATFIPSAGRRQIPTGIPGAGESRIELDGVQ